MSQPNPPTINAASTDTGAPNRLHPAIDRVLVELRLAAATARPTIAACAAARSYVTADQPPPLAAATQATA